MVAKKGHVNTQLLFLFNLHHFIKYLFSWEIMPFLAIFSLAFIFMPFSTLIFGFLKVIILMMVYKMAFDVLADVASGHMTPTTKHNYLVSNNVGIKVALFVLLMELIKMWLKESVYQEYSQDFLILSTFITPAIYMSLAITDSLPKSMNPLVLLKIIKTAYFSYFIFVIFWVASIYLREHILNPLFFNYLPIFISGILTSFIEYAFLLINFQIMGYILYQYRREFDLHEIAGFYPLEEVIIDKNEESKTNPYHERVKSLLVDDKLDLAISTINELQKNGDNSPELTTLLQTAINRKSRESTPEALALKVHNYIAKKQLKRALDIVIELYESEQSYIEHSANDIYPLLKQALSANKIEYVSKIIHDFDEKYPKHIDNVANYFILAKVIYKVREDRHISKSILEKLIKNFPDNPMINEVKAWHHGMKLIENKNF